MAGLDTLVSAKIRKAIKTKLLELEVNDPELPDFVMAMVALDKTKSEMDQNLRIFINDKTDVFTSWLHSVLDQLKTINLEEIKKKKSKKNRKENTTIYSESSLNKDIMREGSLVSPGVAEITEHSQMETREVKKTRTEVSVFDRLGGGEKQKSTSVFDRLGPVLWVEDEKRDNGSLSQTSEVKRRKMSRSTSRKRSRSTSRRRSRSKSRKRSKSMRRRSSSDERSQSKSYISKKSRSCSRSRSNSVEVVDIVTKADKTTTIDLIKMKKEKKRKKRKKEKSSKKKRSRSRH